MYSGQTLVTKLRSLECLQFLVLQRCLPPQPVPHRQPIADLLVQQELARSQQIGTKFMSLVSKLLIPNFLVKAVSKGILAK